MAWHPDFRETKLFTQGCKRPSLKFSFNFKRDFIQSVSQSVKHGTKLENSVTLIQVKMTLLLLILDDTASTSTVYANRLVENLTKNLLRTNKIGTNNTQTLHFWAVPDHGFLQFLTLVCAIGLLCSCGGLSFQRNGPHRWNERKKFQAALPQE